MNQLTNVPCYGAVRSRLKQRKFIFFIYAAILLFLILGAVNLGRDLKLQRWEETTIRDENILVDYYSKPSPPKLRISAAGDELKPQEITQAVTSSPLPTEPRIFPSVANYSKAIITGTVKSHLAALNYMHSAFKDWTLNIYVVDDQDSNITGLSTPKNQGREAGVYLTYIVENYYNLPDIMVFFHGNRWQWHSDDPMYDTVPTIQHLNLDRVMHAGYTSLRCAHWPGCPAWLEPDMDATDPACWHPGCRAVPTQKFNTTIINFPRIERSYAEVFRQFFPDRPIPKAVGSPCCAQFAVSQAQVLDQPLELYQKMLAWVMAPRHKSQSFKVGAIMEHIWHILFGRDAVHCEKASECYCNNFGLCNLKCPSEEECEGRWFRLTKGDMGLPPHWPVQGQREPGLPWEGWWDDPQAVMANTYSGPNAREFSTLSVYKSNF